MSIRRNLAILVALSAIVNTTGAAAADSAQPASTLAVRAVMTGEQVVQILDETVDWYRTLGVQQQSANQPSDLLILYANRQTADKVINLAFEIARANAELLSSEAEDAQKAAGEAASSSQALLKQQQQLGAQRLAVQAEIDSVQRQLAAVPKEQQDAMQAKLSELQSELDLVNARRNLLDTTSQFVYQSDANGSGASALKGHIDAIAASIPSASAGPAPVNATPAGSAPASAGGSAASASFLNGTDESGSRRLGIWDLAANVLRLSGKISTIDAIDRRTAALQDTFTQIRTPPLERIRALTARGDALAHEADTANSATLKGVRDQFDTLAWLFKQTAAILVPLSQEGVLLQQYRHNLGSWRDATRNQYRDALKALGVRVALLLALLAAVFAAAELWRRAVFRYVHESRRRYQLLLVRKIVLWSLVVAIVGFTFATELGSLVTFAGLITAGLAVAMQSVLVSIVGYFFLIGKFGIRVGDRVQIGNVTGEVIDLGLVRLHLMELSGQGPLGPTGRVVAFANSIVFQASGGIFKQIPGVNLAWHEITFTLPPDSDYSAIKEKLLEAANNVINDYREDITRQTKEIQKTTSSHAGGEAQTQVELRFSAASVEALVRYPVQLQRAAEMDERVSRELLNVIRNATTAQGQPGR
jgi:small-conductance mechanosensitive channel